MHSISENAPKTAVDLPEAAANTPPPADPHWARAHAAARQVLPHLKAIALYAALLGPVVAEKAELMSWGTGSGGSRGW